MNDIPYEIRKVISDRFTDVEEVQVRWAYARDFHHRLKRDAPSRLSAIAHARENVEALNEELLDVRQVYRACIVDLVKSECHDAMKEYCHHADRLTSAWEKMAMITSWMRQQQLSMDHDMRFLKAVRIPNPHQRDAKALLDGTETQFRGQITDLLSEEGLKMFTNEYVLPLHLRPNQPNDPQEYNAPLGG